MKTIFTAALLSTMLSSAIAHAAPGQLPLQLSDYILSGGQTEPGGVPVNLLSFSERKPTLESTLARVVCDATESPKICDLRAAAARRAWEVVQAETSETRATSAVSGTPMGLLIPVGLIQVRAIACDPSLSTEECARLEKRIPSNPPGPLPPNAPAPPPTPVPPAVPAPTPPSASADPAPALEPVPVTPPSVIPPPPTGDHDLVKPPPKSGSKMPVIKPKAAPPVNPQPE
jgi:hypothetical protein